MDVVTLALAKQHTDSQRLAYAEEKEYVFDRSLHESEIVEVLGLPCYKVSDEVQDWSGVKSYTFYVMNLSHTIPKEELMVVQESVENRTIFMLVSPDVASPLAISLSDSVPDETGNLAARGTYLAYCPSDRPADCVHIELATIHPIDPKYIPPVDALILNANGKQYRIAVDETGTLTTTEVV